jgi:hypothetical protein
MLHNIANRLPDENIQARRAISGQQKVGNKERGGESRPSLSYADISLYSAGLEDQNQGYDHED